MPRKNKETIKASEHIGAKIKEIRISSGLSLQQVADKMSVTMQQLQKYESGKNRIAAARMNELARALNVQISDFYVTEETTPLTRVDLELNKVCCKLPDQIKSRLTALVKEIVAQREIGGVESGQ